MQLADKAVILARGLGTRMRRPDESVALDAAQSATADTGLKAMISVGRPFLDYVLSGLADAGFTSACLVIGPEHQVVRDYYAQVAPRRIRVEFAVQPDPLGTANALLAAEDFAGADPFIVLNSDNYYPLEVLSALRALGQPGAVMFNEDALVRGSNIPAARIRSFAYARLNDDSFLEDLVEKPDEAAAAALRKDSLVSMNCWRFSKEIFAFCRSVPLSPRGELELPLAVRHAIQSGMRLKVVPSKAAVLDLSVRSDIAAVAHRLASVEVRL